MFLSSYVNCSAAFPEYLLYSLVHFASHMMEEETGKWERIEVTTTKIHGKKEVLFLSNELDSS